MMKRRTKAVCLSPTRNPTHLLAAFCNFVVVVFLFMSLDSTDDLGDKPINIQEFLKYVMYNHSVAIPVQEPEILILSRNVSLKTDIFTMAGFDRYHFKYSVFPYIPRTEMLNKRYNLVVFTTMQYYVTMSLDDRKFVDGYCKQNEVGMIIFTIYKEAQGPAMYTRLNLPVSVHRIKNIQKYTINSNKMLRSLRAGPIRHGFAIENEFAGFKFDHPSYVEIASAMCLESGPNATATFHSAAVEDLGKYDGIRRIILSHGLDLWVNNYLLMDAAHYLSNGYYSMPLKRYIAIEADDIFRAKIAEGGMNVSDFWNLLDMQDRIGKVIPNFRFGLGFNGGGFVETKTKEDEKVHNLFLSYANSFRWYDHTFHHIDIGAIENANDPVSIAEDMEQNRRFAKKYRIPFDKDYVVVKAHGGVYPVIESLYEALELLSYKVTGSDRYWIYNKYKSSSIFAGFKHRGVAVVPRIELGEITAGKSYYDEYEGGRLRIEMKVYEVFLRDFILNYVGIYFIHYRNFAADRIGEYVITEGLKALTKHTHLEIIAEHPTVLAKQYFEFHPEHEVPIWLHPCSQKYLQTLWDSSRSCTRFPHVYVVGPSNTGAAILDFLFTMHPKLIRNTVTNVNSSNGDLQFFDVNYEMGINWYSDHFPDIKIKAYLYEKSDSYYIGEDVPKRIYALSPDAAIIVTMSDPVRRSFAAYKEEKARNNIPKGYTFYDIVTASEMSPPHFARLKEKILKAGCYVVYLKRWLEYYNTPSKIHFVDGDSLRNNTAAVLATVQEFLKLNPRIDYTPKIHAHDGKICMKIEGPTPQPLPPGPSCIDIKRDMDETGLSFEVREFLEDYYSKFDRQLLELLIRNKRPIPMWLRKHQASPAAATGAGPGAPPVGGTAAGAEPTKATS